MSFKNVKDYYAILGVSKAADIHEIKHAYRQLAKRHHPDRVGGSGKITLINEAYATLKDPKRRAEYDASHAYFGVMDVLAKKFKSHLQGIGRIDKSLQSLARRQKDFFKLAKGRIDTNGKIWLKSAHLILEKMQCQFVNWSECFYILTISEQTAMVGGNIHFVHEKQCVQVNLPKGLKDGMKIKMIIKDVPIWFVIRIQE